MKVEKGFTLLEVLIAMTLFGLMLGLVFSTFHMAARAWEAGEPRAAALSGRLVVERFLHDRLASAHGTSGIQGVRPLEGSAHSLSFTAFLPFQVGFKGAQRITLALKGTDLEVEVMPVRGEMAPGERGLRQVILLDHVRALKFRYFYDETWHERWEEKYGLPALVEVSLKIEGGFPWPPLVIALRKGVSVSQPSGFGMLPIQAR